MARAVLRLRREHPSWGAGLIRVQVLRAMPGRIVPSERTLPRWFVGAGLSPAPAGHRPEADSAHAGHETTHGDLVAATDDGNVYLLRGARDGTFQVTLLRSGPACDAACWLLVGDVTGDGKPDLVTAGLDSSMTPQSIQLVENTCP